MSATTHLAAVALTLPCLLFFVLLVRRGQMRMKYAIVWLPIGLAMLVFSVVPTLLDRVAITIGIGYPPALLFVASSVVLTMMCMHFSWELSRLEERVRLLAERMALDGIDPPVEHGKTATHSHGELVDR